MKTFVILGVLFLLVIGCQHDPISDPNIPVNGDLSSADLEAELMAGEIMAVSGWEYDPEVELPNEVADPDNKFCGWILDWSREELAGGVAHYSFLIRTGFGEFDRIMVHRVVKERRPYRPIRTRKNIFLQHGDAVGFVKFLFGPAAPSVPDDHAAAIYLAQNGVDVWGIDQNWVLVPEETSEFAFMEDWGLDNQIANLRTGLAVARFTRLFSGNGFRKMNLLGYSSGAMTGYAYLNDEAMMPRGRRHVQGFVCADMLFKFAPEDEFYRQNICDDVEFQRGRLESGEFADPIPFVPIGELAAFDPDGESPFIEGFTNLQTALFFSAATFQVWPFNEWWHYFGGSFDPESGLPVDLHFTSIDGMTDFMRTGCSWEALRFIYEYEQIMCDEEDVPWDDHIAQVTVPLLLLEPAGGLGSSGRYCLDLFGSTDVQIATASLFPPEQIFEDFGHIDMWTAPQAVELVWEPLLDWIVDHCRGGNGVAAVQDINEVE